jgi:5-methyltetrahydropteroyltriglutamate--homocysteine methyltransferase
MKRSTHRILTTHVGSLPRPNDMAQMIHDKDRGNKPAYWRERLRTAVEDVALRQLDVGLDVINDGEQSKINYYTYINDRLSGFGGETGPLALADLLDFPSFVERVWWASEQAQETVRHPACNGPIEVKNLEDLWEDIEFLKAAKEATGAEDVFMTAVSPGLIASAWINQYYPSREEYLEAIANAMQQEYEAIADAGFILQLDCPDLAMGRHLYYRESSDEEFLTYCRQDIDALNHATRNIDPEVMRMHLCWGNYEGPHNHDVALRDIIELVFNARPHAILFEAANPRHAHEWHVFEHVTVPDEKVIIPGVLDTTTNYIEHPEVVAERLLHYAELVGIERVMAAPDCGFGTTVDLVMVDPEIVYAKLAAMVEGAAIASERFHYKGRQRAAAR